MSTTPRTALATLAIIAGVAAAGLLVFAAIVLPLCEWFPRFSLNIHEIGPPGIAPLIATRTSPPVAVVLIAIAIDLLIAGLLINSVLGWSDGLTGITVAGGLGLVSAVYWSIVGNVPGRVALFTAPIVAATACRWGVERIDRRRRTRPRQ